MGTPQMVHQSTLFMKAGTITGIGDFSAGATQLEYLSETISKQQTRFHSDGIRGSRSKREERIRITQEAVGGQITLNPTPVELDLLLPFILGADEATDVFALAETLKEFGVLVDRGTQRFVYTGCFVNRATFQITQGQPLSLQLDILGKTEVTSASAAPSGSIDTGQIYIASDLTYSLPADASASEVRQATIVIDNMLDGNRYFNSTTRTEIPSTGRSVAVNMNVPYTDDEKDLYDTALAANPGATITLTGTNVSTVFEFGGIEFNAVSPVGQSKASEYMLQLAGNAYASSTKPELKVTHDSNAAT